MTPSRGRPIAPLCQRSGQRRDNWQERFYLFNCIYYFWWFFFQSISSGSRVWGECASSARWLHEPLLGLSVPKRRDWPNGLRDLPRVSCFSCRMLVAFTLTAVVHQSPRSDGPHTSPHLEFKSMSLEYFDLTDSGPTSTSSAAWCPS